MPNTGPESLSGNFTINNTSDKTGEQVHVAAAVIVNGHDEVLISLRPGHVHQGGLWEFPGGKVEPEEDVRDALSRELNEELGITVQQTRPLIRIQHCYPDKHVLLNVFEVTQFEGEAYGREGQECRWVNRCQLHGYDFPEANLPIIRAATLPSRYLITPEPDQGERVFLQSLKKSLETGIRLVQLRAKTLNENEYRNLAVRAIDLCREHEATLLLNTSAEQASTVVGADGIHLTSERLMACSHRPPGKHKLVSASCHTSQQLEHAKTIDADFVVLAPVLNTASHPDAVPLGWERFQALCDAATMPVYALGGMKQDYLNQAFDCGAQGIAGIGSLWVAG